MVKGQYVLSNVRVNTDLTNVDDFREMVIRNDGNGLVRLRDVGTVELGAAATETSALMDGDPAVHLGLFPTPTGNPLVIVDASASCCRRSRRPCRRMSASTSPTRLRASSRPPSTRWCGPWWKRC